LTTVNNLRNEFIFLLGDGVSPEKKRQKTASMRIAHDAKLPSFFFQVIAPSPNKTNKFIPYHLITGDSR
jgi:hypothetical protein